MAAARDEIIGRILLREGGVADVGDGKGITRYGQTPGWLAQFGLPAPANHAEAADNYAAWLRLTRLDRLIGPQADALADAVIDLAVHSGHVTAIKALQVSVDVRADGVIGPMTLAAIQDRPRAAVRVIAWRIEQQGGLIARDPVRYARYALGWARRNAEHVRGLA
jgi:lysozyme family protein